MAEKLVENIHVPVLLQEILAAAGVSRGGVYVDATLGLGGHSEAILRAFDDAVVIGIDQDAAAITLATQRLATFGDRVILIHANFVEIRDVVARAGFGKVDGVIADLGISSLQLDSKERGFSFRFDASLDMRMDADSNDQTAADLLATLSQEEIANLIYLYGEERHSRRIARRIVEKREKGEAVVTTGQLAELVERSVRRSPKDKIHPATRTFQALRIAVNREVEILEGFLQDAVDILKIEGRLAVISFHSLEDRIAKRTFQRLSGKCFCPPRIPKCVCGAAKIVEIITKKPVTPTDAETKDNPRSRSAKLRAVKKVVP